MIHFKLFDSAFKGCWRDIPILDWTNFLRWENNLFCLLVQFDFFPSGMFDDSFLFVFQTTIFRYFCLTLRLSTTGFSRLVISIKHYEDSDFE